MAGRKFFDVLADEATKVKTPASIADEAAPLARTPASKSDAAAMSAKTPDTVRGLMTVDAAASKAMTPTPLGPRDPNAVAVNEQRKAFDKRPAKRQKLDNGSSVSTKLYDEFVDDVVDDNFLSFGFQDNNSCVSRQQIAEPELHNEFADSVVDDDFLSFNVQFEYDNVLPPQNTKRLDEESADSVVINDFNASNAQFKTSCAWSQQGARPELDDEFADSIDDNDFIVFEGRQEKERISSQQCTATELHNELTDSVAGEDFISFKLQQTAPVSFQQCDAVDLDNEVHLNEQNQRPYANSEILSEVQQALQDFNLVDDDDDGDDDDFDCLDIQDPEQDGDFHSVEETDPGYQTDKPKSFDTTGLVGNLSGRVPTTDEMYERAFNLLCKGFPALRDDLFDFFETSVEPDTHFHTRYMERHESFKVEESALSGMPVIDIPTPSGKADLARVAWQLNHPTYTRDEKDGLPGQTLDAKCATTKSLLDKGVETNYSFTFDTINRRAKVRVVNTASGNRIRTRTTEPKTWPNEVQDIHHKYVQWIWENLPFKVLLLCGRENSDLIKRMMRLSTRSVKLDNLISVDVAIWRRENGKIGKVVLFLWHPEFLNRSRSHKLALTYDMQINFAYDLCYAPIRRDFYQSRCKVSAAGNLLPGQRIIDVVSGTLKTVRPLVLETQVLKPPARRPQAERPQVVASKPQKLQASQPKAVEAKAPNFQALKAQSLKPEAPKFSGAVSKSPGNGKTLGTPGPEPLSVMMAHAISPAAATFEQVRRIVVREALKEDMFGDSLPIYLLPVKVLRWLRDNTAFRKRFEARLEDVNSPIEALQSLLDPKGEAKEAFLLACFAGRSFRLRVRAKVFDLLTRGPEGDDPTRVQLICSTCKDHKDVLNDMDPRFSIQEGWYIARSSHVHKCRTRTEPSLYVPLNQELLFMAMAAYMDHFLQIVRQYGFVSDNVDESAEAIKPLMLQVKRAHRMNRKAAGEKFRDDLLRGPKGEELTEIMTQCKNCGRREVDENPRYQISPGRYVAPVRFCTTEKCTVDRTGVRQRKKEIPFDPVIDDDSVPDHQRYIGKWINMSAVDQERKDVLLKAMKVVKASVADAEKRCQRKPEVRSLLIVCSDCNKTEFIDDSPLFYGDSYLSKPKRKPCTCPGTKEKHFIPKEVPGEKTWGYIKLITLKNIINTERREAAKAAQVAQE